MSSPPPFLTLDLVIPPFRGRFLPLSIPPPDRSCRSRVSTPEPPPSVPVEEVGMPLRSFCKRVSRRAIDAISRFSSSPTAACAVDSVTGTDRPPASRPRAKLPRPLPSLPRHVERLPDADPGSPGKTPPHPTPTPPARHSTSPRVGSRHPWAGTFREASQGRWCAEDAILPMAPIPSVARMVFPTARGIALAREPWALSAGEADSEAGLSYRWAVGGVTPSPPPRVLEGVVVLFLAANAEASSCLVHYEWTQ